MKFHLNASVIRHTDEQLLADLRRTARKLKKDTISNKQYRLIGRYCPGVIARRFGTWNSALQKAGLKVSKQYNVPATDLLENLYNLWLTLGRQPSLANLHPP